MKPLTPIQQRAYAILKRRGPMRGSDLGWELWGKGTGSPSDCNGTVFRGTGCHLQNKFCRPAGKLLRQLQRLGKVYEQPALNCTIWRAL